jgi:itaconate CoA-transferase
MNDVTALARHPQLRARGRWRMVATPVGEIEALLPPVDLWGVAPRRGVVPALGAQTEAVLTECGFSPGEIARLRGADRD